MCEPANSIVQVPVNSALIAQLSNNVLNFGREVGNFYHFSALGNGHSELASLCGISPLMMEGSTISYEADWWNRHFRVDYGYYTPKGVIVQHSEEFQAAQQYANKVSIGSLSILRNFLEMTFQKSDRPHLYLNRMQLMLNKDGQIQYQKGLKRIGIAFRSEMSMLFMPSNRLPKKKLEAGVKLALGFTRKRNLLVSNWADDDELWDKKGREVAINN